MFSNEKFYFDFSHDKERENYFGDLLFETSLDNGCSSFHDIEPLEVSGFYPIQKEISIPNTLMMEEGDVIKDFYKRQISQVSSARLSTHGTYSQVHKPQKSIVSAQKEIAESHTQEQKKLDSEKPFNSGTLEQNENDNNEEKVEFSARKRFNKIHDREMFKRLHELCQECQVQVSDFWNSSKILSAALWKILEKIAVEISWSNCKLDQLLGRIKRIGKNQYKFTARDNKLLRKLINQQKRKGYVNYEEVMYYFPGKTLDTIKSKYAEKWSSVVQKEL